MTDITQQRAPAPVRTAPARQEQAHTPTEINARRSRVENPELLRKLRGL